MIDSSPLPAAAAQKSWLLGLIGFPLAHSLSPRLHGAALRSFGLLGEYRLFPIPPSKFPDQIDILLGKMRASQIDGLNVTIPYKTAVIPYLDELSETAAQIGAVNTIYSRSGKLFGENTDAQGFLLDLQRLGVMEDPSTSSKNALILGSGGSARAVCYALLSAGWHLHFAVRNPAHARELYQHFSATNPEFIRLLHRILHISEVDQTPEETALIVNTTPVGMFPDVEQSIWPVHLPFPPKSFVYDLVYNPPHTRLMELAQSQGLAYANGMGMLVNQAALAFERWTGLKADLSMWETLNT